MDYTHDIGRTIKMTIQEIVAELNNIKEQAVNHDDITKNSMIEAITDLIHDAGGNDGFDFSFEDDDHYDSFQETDFTNLEVM